MQQFSGRNTAPTTPTSILTDEINLDIGLVKISVASTEASGVFVCAYNDSDGIDIEPGNSSWFPVQNLKFLKVGSVSGTVQYTYFAR